MNDQSQMMNQQPPQMLNQMISQPPPPQIQMMAQSQAQQSQIMKMNQSKQQSQPLPMLNRGYNKVWPQHASMDHPSNKFHSSSSLKPNYTAALKPGRSNWKGKKVSDKHKNPRRMEKSMSIPMPMPNPAITGPSGSGGGYKPPALYELQSQNRFKARKFHQKKKYNNRFAPFAPRNTTSFIIRAKKTGGIADLVSPCPVTPAVLPTPIFSPSREVLGDMAKEEWGVDGYGSMKGLIRLRSPGGNEHEEEEEDENGGSSESDVEERVEVERRLDHDLSRFEMIYPNYSGLEYHNVLENRVDDQDSHIAQLEEENLTLKERLFLMERELGDLRRRLQFLERQNQVMGDVNEEVVENGSENESEGGLDAPALMGFENNADMEYVPGKGGKERTTDNENDVASGNEGVSGVCMEEFEERNELLPKEVIADKNEPKGEQFVKENVVKDADMRTESVRNEVIAVENDAKNEERRNELLPNEAAIAKEEVKVEKVANKFVSDVELTSVNDGTGVDKAMDKIVVGENEFTNEELRNVFSEKSIGDGD